MHGDYFKVLHSSTNSSSNSMNLQLNAMGILLGFNTNISYICVHQTNISINMWWWKMNASITLVSFPFSFVLTPRCCCCCYIPFTFQFGGHLDWTSEPCVKLLWIILRSFLWLIPSTSLVTHRAGWLPLVHFALVISLFLSRSLFQSYSLALWWIFLKNFFVAWCIFFLYHSLVMFRCTRNLFMVFVSFCLFFKKKKRKKQTHTHSKNVPT